jgi:hypothetical protein
MKRDKKDKLIGQIIRIGTEVKTIVLWHHIVKKYFMDTDCQEMFLTRSPRFSWAFRQIIISELFMRLAKLNDLAESRTYRNISFLAEKNFGFAMVAESIQI